MTLHHPKLFQQINTHTTIVLDTNVFSVASHSKDFAEFLVELRSNTKCAYTTIPPVVFEVTNGSSNLEIYNQRAEYINTTVDSIIPINFLDKIIEFSFMMAKLNSTNNAYTDYQLAALLYQYRHVDIYLMTADLKALPSFFYDREFIITATANKGDVKNFGLFKFNETNYVKAMKKVFGE